MADDVSDFTQTYSTAAVEVTAASAVVVATTGATAETPYGFAEAQANAIVVNLNALVADVLQLRKLLNGVIDELQNDGITD